MLASLQKEIPTRGGGRVSRVRLTIQKRTGIKVLKKDVLNFDKFREGRILYWDDAWT